MMGEYGRSLARLHNLSERYKPAVERWTWENVLSWAAEVFAQYGAAECAFAELWAVERELHALPRSRENYGLVHYDFEPDNVFYDGATGACHVIDFDDAMVHWYAVDLEQALGAIEEDMDSADTGHLQAAFLKGYRAERGLTAQELETQPLMRRFVNLYAYARLIRCVAERPDSEPDWMLGLRRYLEEKIARLEASFKL